MAVCLNTKSSWLYLLLRFLLLISPFSSLMLRELFLLMLTLLRMETLQDGAKITREQERQRKEGTADLSRFVPPDRPEKKYDVFPGELKRKEQLKREEEARKNLYKEALWRS